jgi:hypothetical protein
LTASTFRHRRLVRRRSQQERGPRSQPRLGLPLSLNLATTATISFLGYEIDSQPRKKA